jgi:hypothetical protein
LEVDARQISHVFKQIGFVTLIPSDPVLIAQPDAIVLWYLLFPFHLLSPFNVLFVGDAIEPLELHIPHD